MPETNTTVGALVDTTLGHLLGSAREEMNRLTAQIGATDITISVDFDVAGMTRGTYIAIDDEVMYVWSSTQSPNEVTVQRGMQGTTAATHAAGTLIKVNPYFTRAAVRQALQDEIRSWPPQVYAVRSQDIPIQGYVRGYDMGAIGAFFHLLECRIRPAVAIGQTDPNTWPIIKAELVHSASTAEFPSGNGLILRQDPTTFQIPALFTDGQTPLGTVSAPWAVHVVWAAPFDVDSSFDDSTDLLTEVGVDISDFDIPPYGAAWRLVGFREIRRTFTEAQGQPSDLQEEPNLASARTAAWLKSMRDSRLADARIRLAAQYAIRRSD